MNVLTKIDKLKQLRGTICNISRNLCAQKVSNVTSTLPQVTVTSVDPNPWIWRKNNSIKLPVGNNLYKTTIDLPNGLKWVPPLIEPETTDNVVEAPSTVSSEVSKEAAKLIQIRKKKMKKHKLKKLRKRTKFESAKRRQRREMKKEKAFQAELIQQCKASETFSAEKYVEERIMKLNELLAATESVNKRVTRK